MKSPLSTCLRHKAALLPILLLCSGTAAVADGQTRKPPPQTTVLLVDTDDSCKLTVDDQDEGVITPAQSKKVNVGLGDHIVKCVIENIPDLVWRKVVEAKGSQQVAAMIALKALHIQYDQAVGHVQQQKEQAVAAKVQVEAAEEKRKSDEAQLPEKLFGQLKGVWRWQAHTSIPDTDPYTKEQSTIQSDEEEILDFQSLEGRTIMGHHTWNRGITGGEVWHHTVWAFSFHVPPPSIPGESRMIEKTITYTHNLGKHKKGTETEAFDATPSQGDFSVRLLDSTHLEVGQPGNTKTYVR